jgi:protein-tyrosine-phosphatase
MKRNVFGAAIVAGGLALFTTVAGFADYTTGPAAKAAIATCASTVVLTDPATLTGEAATEATALNAETTAGLAEITAEANSNIDEAVAETTDEDGVKDATALSAQLTETVVDACKAIANLKAEYDAAIAELKAESAQVKQPEVEKQDVEKPETETRDAESNRSENSGSDREGSD